MGGLDIGGELGRGDRAGDYVIEERLGTSPVPAHATDVVRASLPWRHALVWGTLAVGLVAGLASSSVVLLAVVAPACLFECIGGCLARRSFAMVRDWRYVLIGTTHV